MIVGLNETFNIVNIYVAPDPTMSNIYQWYLPAFTYFANVQFQ